MSIRDLDGKVLRQYFTDGTSWTPTDYIYRGRALVARWNPVTGDEHIHVDHLGSVRQVTDAQGQPEEFHVFEPYGEEYTLTSSLDPFRFTGHERDLGKPNPTNRTQAAADDVDYMHARHYAPLFGRFLSVDPVRGQGGAPQTWNRYAYALGNPILYLDPFGLESAENEWGYVGPPVFGPPFLPVIVPPGIGDRIRNGVEFLSQVWDAIPKEDTIDQCGLFDGAIGQNVSLFPFDAEVSLAAGDTGGAAATLSLRSDGSILLEVGGGLAEGFGYASENPGTLLLSKGIDGTPYSSGQLGDGGQGFGAYGNIQGGFSFIGRTFKRLGLTTGRVGRLGRVLSLTGGSLTAFGQDDLRGVVEGRVGAYSGLSGVVGLGYRRYLLNPIGKRCNQGFGWQ